MIIQTQHGKFSCSTPGKVVDVKSYKTGSQTFSHSRRPRDTDFILFFQSPTLRMLIVIVVTSGWWEVGEKAVFYSTHFLHFPKHTRMHDAQWCLLLLLLLSSNTILLWLQMQGGTVSVVTAACHCQHHPGALIFPWCTSCKLKWQDLRWTWSLTIITATSTGHRLPVSVSRSCAQHALRSLNTLKAPHLIREERPHILYLYTCMTTGGM